MLLPICLNCVTTIGVCVFCAAASVAALFNLERNFTIVNYKKPYFRLFNAITDAIEILQKAQIDAEDAYIEDDGDEESLPNVTKFKVYSANKKEEK